MDGRGGRRAAAVEQQQSEVALAEFPAAAPGRFIDDNTSFVQEFPVRGYEVAPNQRASMVTVANLLQVSHTIKACSMQAIMDHMDCMHSGTGTAFMNSLQELAGNHAVGMWGRAEKGFASLPNAPDIIFVMTRLQIRMEQYPKVRGPLGKGIGRSDFGMWIVVCYYIVLTLPH